MKHRSNDLREELRLAGASNAEVKELMSLAASFKQLKHPAYSLLEDKSRRQYWDRWKRLLPIATLSLVSLCLGMTLVILSQTVLPGNVLYPLQRLSDNLSISVNPSYRGTVMMKRAQEVKQLIADHADSSLVLATLADYQSEALAYKSSPVNYAVFEYCKANLQQAAALAPDSERQAITSTLASLRNV